MKNNTSIKSTLHNSVLPAFALVLCHHVTAGFMSPSCPFAFVWPSDSLTDSQGESGSPAVAAPPGRWRPRGSCRRSWRCLQETSPSLLWWMSRWRSDDEEGHEPGSCTLIGWRGRGVGRSARLWCGWCWWRGWSCLTYRQGDRGGGCFMAVTVEWRCHLVVKLTGTQAEKTFSL